jgi:Ca2+-transporting ATPase
VLVLNLNLLHGARIGLVVEMGIALAVAAVPEALPAVATIALGIGLRGMAARRALIRRLAAVEALGSVTVICSDKTRTLTSGDMTLVRLWTPEAVLDLTAPPADPLATPAWLEALEVAVLASRPRPGAGAGDARVTGDPVDAALLRGAEQAGLDVRALWRDRPTVGVVPFSTERR